MSVDLRAERRLRGKLLREVAEEIGISVPMMSVIENGHRRPSPPVALKIATLYGKKIVDIWPDFGSPEPTTEEAA